MTRVIFLIFQSLQEPQVGNPVLVADEGDQLEYALLGPEGVVKEHPVLLLRDHIVMVEVREEVW